MKVKINLREIKQRFKSKFKLEDYSEKNTNFESINTNIINKKRRVNEKFDFNAYFSESVFELKQLKNKVCNKIIRFLKLGSLNKLSIKNVILCKEKSNSNNLYKKQKEEIIEMTEGNTSSRRRQNVLIKKEEDSIIFKIKKWVSNFLKNKNRLEPKYYALLIAMFLLLGTSLGILFKSNAVLNKENYTEVGKEDLKQVISSIVDEDTKPKEENKVSNNDEKANKVKKEGQKIVQAVTTNKNTQKTTNNKTVVKKEDPEKEQLNFVKPVEGIVIKPFSMDELVYSKTLGIWKTHRGTDISSKTLTSVKAAERGKIVKIYEDTLYGMTIEISHRQGYVTKYSNLDNQVSVKLNQEVIKGQTIGKVGKTAISEIEDEEHLHIELYINGNIKDPLKYIKY